MSRQESVFDWFYSGDAKTDKWAKADEDGCLAKRLKDDWQGVPCLSGGNLQRFTPFLYGNCKDDRYCGS